MDIKLSIPDKNHLPQFKKEMQKAFQQGAVDYFGRIDEEILPESHIDLSLEKKGSVAYEALVDGELAGGAIVIIDTKTQCNCLDFLYVKKEFQGKGIGCAVWQSIEKLYPETKIWETVTPYFEKRNIHFYVNKCKFVIVEFYQECQSQADDISGGTADWEEDCGMFRLKKIMRLD